LFAWKPRVIDYTTAIFRQVNKDNSRTHHDALEIPDGQIVLLNDVFEGQEATLRDGPGCIQVLPRQKKLHARFNKWIAQR